MIPSKRIQNGPSSLIDQKEIQLIGNTYTSDIDADVDILPIILGRKRFSEIAKRFFDIICATAGIIINLPLMLIIAILIKLESRGPIFFKQTRIGLNRRRIHEHRHSKSRRLGPDLKGKPIIIYKFRTMKAGANPYAVSPANGDDVRITRLGRLLRSTCMDELPQFFSVLKGDMSIVGPRPEMQFIVERYGPRESLRLMVKPGLTGLWQLRGSRTLQIHEDLSHDLEYLQNSSTWLDIRIIFSTLIFMFRGKNT